MVPCQFPIWRGLWERSLSIHSRLTLLKSLRILRILEPFYLKSLLGSWANREWIGGARPGAGRGACRRPPAGCRPAWGARSPDGPSRGQKSSQAPGRSRLWALRPSVSWPLPWQKERRTLQTSLWPHSKPSAPVCVPLAQPWTSSVASATVVRGARADALPRLHSLPESSPELRFTTRSKPSPEAPALSRSPLHSRLRHSRLRARPADRRVRPLTCLLKAPERLPRFPWCSFYIILWNGPLHVHYRVNKTFQLDFKSQSKRF